MDLDQQSGWHADGAVHRDLTIRGFAMTWADSFGARRSHAAPPLVLPVGYRDLPAMLGALTASRLGMRAKMMGADGITECFELEATAAPGSPGAKLSSGRIKLWPLDGTEGWRVGTEVTDDIQLLGAATAPTWGAAGASTGGLIHNGSGAHVLRFMDAISGAGNLALAARIVPVAPVETDEQEFAIGHYSPAAGTVLGGGAERFTTAWFRQTLYSSPIAPLSLNSAQLQYKFSEGLAPGVFCVAQIPAHRATDIAAFLAGGYTVDSSPSALWQRVSSGSGLANASQEDFLPWLWATANGGELTARFTDIFIMELAP
jgi:hypothetical protein